MTDFILFGIVVLASATLYASRKKGLDIFFDKIFGAYLVFVIIHAVFAFIVRAVVITIPTIDMAAPFVLGYGPFFYLGLKSMNNKFSKKDVYLHFTPLLFFFAVYFILISDKGFMAKYLMSFYITQYSFVTIGFLGYAFWALLQIPVLNQGINSKEKERLIKTCGFSLGIMGLVFAVIVLGGFLSTDDIKGELPGIIIYLGVFSSVVLAFVFIIDNMLRSSVNQETIAEKISYDTKEIHVLSGYKIDDKKIKFAENIPAAKYNKSALSRVVLDDYKDKLDKFINIEKVYLDNELTLESLAKKMRMPMHHLTQLFNVHLGENFNQYINKFRVEHACGLLLEKEGSLSIEQIAFNSGFSSKVSFNRHFKNITGYTPKEYSFNIK